MQNVWNIARRQFAAYFNGPVGYIVLGTVLLFVGIFFWTTFFLAGRATVRDLFMWLGWLVNLSAGAVTMGLIAEEKRNGTIELLITMPVRDAEVILGKFLGAMGLLVVLLLLTLPYPITVSTLGNLDWGTVWTAYFGMILQGGAILAIGLMASGWTDNQIVAFFVTLLFAGFFSFVDKFLPFLPSSIASVMEWLSFDYHFRSMGRGVIDSRDVVFFLSVIVVSLSVAFRSLESRKWS